MKTEKIQWFLIAMILLMGIFMLVFLVLPKHKIDQEVNRISASSSSGTIIRKEMVVQEIDGLITYQYIFTLQFHVTLTDNLDHTYTGYNTILVTTKEYQEYNLYDYYYR